MEIFVMIFMACTLVEGLTEIIKDLIGEAVPDKIGKLSTFKLVSLALAIAVAVGLSIDVFKLLGMDFKIPVIGYVLTGIAMSRGSNYLFDWLNKLKKPVPPVKIEAQETKTTINL